MHCANAQDAIMEQVEGRLCPLQALALHRHINECDSCREFYLEFMEITAELTEVETKEAPEGFVSAVMEQILAEPAYTPLIEFDSTDIPVENSPKSSSGNFNWLRIVGCLYALSMSIGFAVFYNPDLGGLGFRFTENLAIISANVSQWFMQVGQNLNAQDISTFSNYVLAIAALLAAALVYTLHRERV